MDILSPDVPLTYVQLFREEHHSLAPSFVGEPEDRYYKLLPENVAWHEPPDPIRESRFWNAGYKIKPDAHMWIAQNTGLGWWQNWEDDTFHVGKLLGYIYTQMHQGGQRPIDYRGNLQEAVPATFGSMYEVSPIVTTPGPAYTSAGFDLSGIDGYPY